MIERERTEQWGRRAIAIAKKRGGMNEEEKDREI